MRLPTRTGRPSLVAAGIAFVPQLPHPAESGCYDPICPDMPSPSPTRRSRAAALACAALLSFAATAAGAADDVETLVAARYPDVLAKFAAGQHDAALSALAALETQITASGPPSRVDKLWKAKLHVLRDLIDDPEVLVPVIQLHHDAFVAYHGEGKTILARHSRVMTAELAEVYADRVGSDAARVVAARALSSLGGYQQEDGSIGSASEHFVAALKLDPKCPAALLGQAVMYEKLGQYAQAVPMLERLLAAEKNSPQAKLRLALNLARTKETKRATALLAELTQPAPAGAAVPEADWVAALAFEEQARILADAGAPRPAAELLRKAGERFPEGSEMLVARAYFLERAGDRTAAQEVAEHAHAIATRTGAVPQAPRWLYNHWPQIELEEARRRLRESTEPRLKRLEGALHGESAITTVTEGHR